MGYASPSFPRAGFDYPTFAHPHRDTLRATAESIAAEAGVEIEYIRKSKAFRKEKRIQSVLKERGDHPGLVHIFSAMESCSTYQPWHDKRTHKTYLKSRVGKCLHYYFYFIDEQLGLCYMRVPTWCPPDYELRGQAVPPAVLLQWASLVSQPTDASPLTVHSAA